MKSPKGWLLSRFFEIREKIEEASDRLSRVDLGNNWIIFFVATLNLAAIVLFEALNYLSRLPTVILIAIASELVFWSCYFSLLFVKRKLFLNKKSILLRAIGVLGLSHLARSITREILYATNGVTAEFELWQRLPGDLSLAIFFLMGIAYAQTATRELANQEQELTRTREYLIDSSNTAEDFESPHLVSMRRRVQEAVLTPLDVIVSKIRSSQGRSAKRVAKEIELLISQKVRPLSHSLWDLLRADQTVAEFSLPKKGRFPKRVHIAKDFMAGSIAVLAGSNILFTVLGLTDLLFTAQFALVFCSYPLIGWMLSGLLAGLKDWPRFFGAVAITLLSLMAWIPTLLFIHVNSTLWDDLSVIETSGSAVLIVATLLTTLWSAFKRERLLFLAELDSVNSQISRANKIKSQMNWVSARAWTYLIHGGVQSSLSIANYKLRAASKIDIDVLADVIKDLEHAKRLLEAGVVPFESWRERISSLKGAWKGVCVVSFDQSDEALEVVTSDATASSCISEVCKELVSNAFRHGGATKIRFSLTLAKPGELLLESSNNGNPLPEKVTHGLGIELYRELTSSYDLRNEDSSVVFSGLFPFDSGARPKQTEAI